MADPRHGTNIATGLAPSARSRRRSAAAIDAAIAAESISSRSSARSGAITGTLRNGNVSSGATKIVLPLTCIVYCEAPITVARMRASGRASGTPRCSARARISAASRRPRSPNDFRVAAVDVFGDAAGERDDVRSAPRRRSGARRMRLAPAGRGRAAIDRVEQAIRHARRKRARMLRIEHRSRARARCRARRRSAGRPPRSARCGPRRRRPARRAPTSSAVTSTTLPSRHTAIFAVPPPTSTFMTVAPGRGSSGRPRRSRRRPAWPRGCRRRSPPPACRPGARTVRRSCAHCAAAPRRR